MNRRQFVQSSAGAAAFLTLRSRAYPFGQSPTKIRKFFVPLPGLGPTGIPVLTPDTGKFPGTDYYEIVAKQFSQKIHPDLPNPTTFWGYADAANPSSSRYLGGVIVAKQGRPVKLKVKNQLPSAHIVPFDLTAMDPPFVSTRVDRITVHLHGGLVHWNSDGGPFSWFTNPANSGFVTGVSFINGVAGEPGAAIYDYPNNQSARFVWYHDHTYGNTRLNAYAGMASGYVITDDAEANLIKEGVFPNIPGFPLGIPLIIQDKMFFDPASDPTYTVPGAVKGSLWYPHKYESPATGQQLPAQTLSSLDCGKTGRWDDGPGSSPVSLVPEFFADTMLVNGAPYPFVPVAPRRYRFRVLDASQARFLNLQLYVADGSTDGITLEPSTTETDNNGNPLLIPRNAAGPRILQIGTEGGFLPFPVVLNHPPKPIGYIHSTTVNDPKDGDANRYNLLLAPGERADIIVDFRGFAGQKIILYNDASAPFPGGDIRNDYHTGRPDLTCIGGAPANAPGFGPDTRVIMQFQVAANGSVSEMSFDQTFAALAIKLPVVFLTTQPAPLLPFGLQPKTKTLNEDSDNLGRLRQLLGSPTPTGYLAAPTEIANKGEVQLWKIYNTTADTHPMHFHLVNVQVVSREAYQFNPDGSPKLPLSPIGGTFRFPDLNELGWKETVRMNPGEVTTVLMKFDLPPGTVPDSPRLQTFGINGAEYVWHCHILEHEEHDMMRPIVVTG